MILCRHEFRRISFRANQQNDHLENIKQLQNYTIHKINKHIIVHLHLHSEFCISFDFILIHTFIHWFNYILFSFLSLGIYTMYFKWPNQANAICNGLPCFCYKFVFLSVLSFFALLLSFRFYQFRMCVILVFVCNCSSVLLAFSVRKPNKIAMRWDLRQYQNRCIATKERKLWYLWISFLWIFRLTLICFNIEHNGFGFETKKK